MRRGKKVKKKSVGRFAQGSPREPIEFKEPKRTQGSPCDPWTEKDRKGQKRTEKNRKEQKRTEKHRKEQKRTEKYRKE